MDKQQMVQGKLIMNQHNLNILDKSQKLSKG